MYALLPIVTQSIKLEPNGIFLLWAQALSPKSQRVGGLAKTIFAFVPRN